MWQRGRSCAILAVLLAMSAGAAVQAQSPAPSDGGGSVAAGDLRFDVASVKLTPFPADRRYVIVGQFTVSGFDGTYMSLKQLIQSAYGISRGESIIGPAWLDSEMSPYSISAKAAKAAPERTLRIMLQNLLAERFDLKVHMENREMPVYALMLEKGGMKAKQVVYEEADADRCVRPLPTGLEAHHCSMAAFSKVLAGAMFNVGRPVVDKTGLSGRFDFTLQYLTKGFAPLLDPPPGEGGATIFDALKTVGLKLEAQKGGAEVLVIDRVSRTPTEN